MELINFGSGSSGNCYIVHLKNGLYAMLDCGVPLKRVKFNFNNLSFAFISHDHLDHSLNREKLVLRGIPIVEGNLARDYSKNATKIKFDGNTSVSCDLFTFPVKHGECKNGGLVIKTENEIILYVTDFSVAKIPGFKYTNIIIECNYNFELMEGLLRKCIISHDISGRPNYSGDATKLIRQINTHMSDAGLIDLLRKFDLSHCECIYLVHNSVGCGEPIVSAARIHAATNCKVAVCKKEGGVDYYE